MGSGRETEHQLAMSLREDIEVEQAKSGALKFVYDYVEASRQLNDSIVLM